MKKITARLLANEMTGFFRDIPAAMLEIESRTEGATEENPIIIGNTEFIRKFDSSDNTLIFLACSLILKEVSRLRAEVNKLVRKGGVKCSV